MISTKIKFLVVYVVFLVVFVALWSAIMGDLEEEW